MTAEEKFLKDLGKNIDRIRREKGLSFQEMAHRSDIEKANLVKLTSQGTNITALTLYKIAKGLGVPVRELFRT